MAARRLLDTYRATGATPPFGDPRAAHGVEMEGYYWRITDPDARRVIVALVGVCRAPDGDWAATAVAAEPGRFGRTRLTGAASASPVGLGVSAGEALRAGPGRLFARPSSDAHVDVRLDARIEWPHRALGGLGAAQAMPALGQYWHPHLLGACVEGSAQLGGESVELSGATAYAEKNWGAGFPGRWWWGQAHGFDDAEVCVAFAGGVLHSRPVEVAATSLVVHLGQAGTIRLVPPLAVTSARTGEDAWLIRGRSARHRITVEGDGNGTAPHLLPVPIASERRTVDRARQFLTGRLRLEVRTGRRISFRGESTLAGLELGAGG